MPFQKQPIQDFIGSGLAFPIRLDKGRAVASSGFDIIKSSISIILSWNFGQRFFLPEFGSRITELLEEPNDEVLKQVLYTFVVDPITKWEKRINLIEARIVDIDASKVSVFLKYRVKNSQTEDSYIFPFYRKLTS